VTAPCPERTFGIGGEFQCTQGLGHDKGHAAYEGDRLRVAWVTREEFEAARARGEFDVPDICHCADPVPVCDSCGGDL
jgi:hypothetical protein